MQLRGYVIILKLNGLFFKRRVHIYFNKPNSNRIKLNLAHKDFAIFLNMEFSKPRTWHGSLPLPLLQQRLSSELLQQEQRKRSVHVQGFKIVKSHVHKH